MVLTKTPVDFVERSLQLLQAHPNTTRITTTYHISPPPSSDSKSRPKPTKPDSNNTAAAEPKPKVPRGKLTLKTYDPISGSIIKFKTDKISDVGRLVAGLHRLGRGMSGLADVVAEVPSAAAAAVGGDAPIVSKDAVAAAVTEGTVEQPAGAGGSKGGKKKNKKKR